MHSARINWWERCEDWALDWIQGLYKHQTGQPLLEAAHRELTDLPGIKLTEMFNWHLKTQSLKIKANPIQQWPCENSYHQCTARIWISTSLREVTGMRTTVWPKSQRGIVGFVTIWSVSKAPSISCLLGNLLWVPLQSILTETGTPSHKNLEVCKTHLQKLCCYLRVCIFLCCQVANLRYAEFNIRFRWLVRCWLNGENSRNTRSW